eukprot:COSAG01_NODE_38670_length_486_cov_4.914729_1_plen_137_part_10
MYTIKHSRWSTRRFGHGWQQPPTTHIITQRLFYATSGYQRMRPVTSDHKEGCRQGARLPATRQRAQGYCNQLGRSGRPGGRQQAQFTMQTDPTSGRPYYINVDTRQTTWTLPPGGGAWCSQPPTPLQAQRGGMSMLC